MPAGPDSLQRHDVLRYGHSILLQWQVLRQRSSLLRRWRDGQGLLLPGREHLQQQNLAVFVYRRHLPCETKRLNIIGPIIVDNKDMKTKLENNKEEITPAVNAIVAITSSASPFAVKAQPRT